MLDSPPFFYCVAVWWNDRAINTHSESGAVVPDEDYVPSPGWALGKTGFHALGAQCKDKCGSCTKCKRHDTWGVTCGSDSLKDVQPLKPATTALNECSSRSKSSTRWPRPGGTAPG